MLVGLVCIPPPQDTQVVQKTSRESRERHLFAVFLSLVQVKLLQRDCWTLKIYIALLRKGLYVSFEL